MVSAGGGWVGPGAGDQVQRGAAAATPGAGPRAAGVASVAGGPGRLVAGPGDRLGPGGGCGDCGAFSGPTVRVSGLGRVLEGPRRAGGDGAPGGGLPLHSAVCGYAAVPVPSAAAGGVRPGAAPGAGGLGWPALRAGALAAAAGPGAAGASGVGGALPCGDGGLPREVHSLSAAGDAVAGDLRGADAGVCSGLGAGTG